ncbi:hypothetical protein C8034_v006686 [Colletotrichum sidae]|uniref:Uncharacterized protein n=1 Tax=Colletotrichum sidae TaxID=1347389 RepID=A0A4R8S9Y6_9PEZI|nr:hypothetical protein C8034_v006686 [Colletotrichum sidae]
MSSTFPVNRQTAFGLLMLLILFWSLSMFFETTPQALKPIKPDHPNARPLTVPEQQSPDRSKRPPANVPASGQQPEITVPPWYEDENEKGPATASKPAADKMEHASSADATQSKPSAAAEKPSKQGSSTSASSVDKPLILYAYAESESGRENLQFFVKQGLHDEADFVFILNGETDAATLIPQKKNIKVVHRENTCFDLGAYGEILRHKDLYKHYKRFITLNASIRGPFLPHWAQSCWSDLYLNRITEKVKLVGMTANCWPRFHVQSMIWATDAVGIDLLLNPPASSSITDQFGTSEDPVGMAGCYDGWNAAVHAEVGATSTFLKQGYEVDLMMTAFHKSKNYIDECDSTENGDMLWNGKYFGTNIHPYETIFIKANRDIDPTLIQHLTEWQQASNFTSYAACSTKS